MEHKDCFRLGFISKPHGLDGAVAAHFDVDQPAEYKKLESVFIEINDSLIPFFIDQISIDHHGKAVIRFEDMKNVGDAEDISGCELFLPLSVLPPLTGNKFYFHEIIGFKVVDKTDGDIGIIEEILDLPMQSVIKTNLNGTEVLIPVADEVIVAVNRNNKIIEVDLPHGLLDIYLNRGTDPSS